MKTLTRITLILAPMVSVSWAVSEGEFIVAYVLFFGWLYVLYRERHWFKKDKSELDVMYEMCINRDRTQSFDDWVRISIQEMAIDEVESGVVDEILATELKEKWGKSWDLYYPIARVEQELSKEESYWTALRKFDEAAEKKVSGK